jgi:hypothetical protein
VLKLLHSMQGGGRQTLFFHATESARYGWLGEHGSRTISFFFGRELAVTRLFDRRSGVLVAVAGNDPLWCSCRSSPFASSHAFALAVRVTSSPFWCASRFTISMLPLK